MDVALVQHIVDKTEGDEQLLRVWVGILGDTAVQEDDLEWRLNDTPIMPITPAATGNLTKAPWHLKKHVFQSGIFDFTLPDAAPRQPTYTLGLKVKNGPWIERPLRHRVSQVPTGIDQSLNILLLSCYHNDADKAGKAGELLAQRPHKPDLTLLMGDQVYLDLPLFMDFKDDADWLEERFFEEYRKNWFGLVNAAGGRGTAKGFPRILSLGPIAAIPDDHEYWNNAPLPSPIIQNSLRKEGRVNWIRASEKALHYFQTGKAPLGKSRIIEFDPVSIFLLDTRSQRPNDDTKDFFRSGRLKKTGALITTEQMRDFKHWIKTLLPSAKNGKPRYGMLVTGQSLFRQDSSWWTERIKDAELPDYKSDYENILASIKEVSTAGLPFVCLTGDVHWGRILKADFGTGSAPVYEIISSPTSELEAVDLGDEEDPSRALKTISKIYSRFTRKEKSSHQALFEKRLKDAVPKSLHASIRNPELLPLTGGRTALMVSNMGVMLRLSRRGPGVDLHVDYIPLHARTAKPLQGWSTTLHLKPVT